MVRRKQVPPKESNFVTEPYMEVDGFPVNAGDTIKIKEEWGTRFKFVGVTTNTLTGASWVDCFELNRNIAGVFRSFSKERVKRVPKRGKRAKRVNN